MNDLFTFDEQIVNQRLSPFAASFIPSNESQVKDFDILLFSAGSLLPLTVRVLSSLKNCTRVDGISHITVSFSRAGIL